MQWDSGCWPSRGLLAQHTKHRRSRITVGNCGCRRAGSLSSRLATDRQGPYLCCAAGPRGRFWALRSASRVWCDNVCHGAVTGANSPICLLWREESAPGQALPCCQGAPLFLSCSITDRLLALKSGTSVSSLQMLLSKAFCCGVLKKAYLPYYGYVCGCVPV